MRVSEPEVVIDGLYFPECLRWHDDRLWFSDMLAGTVHTARGDGQDVRTVTEVPGDAGGLGWLPGGDLLVVAMRERRILRLDPDGDLRQHADLTPLIQHTANDMYVDGQGRALVSSYGFDVDNGAPVAPIPLVAVNPGGTVRLAGDPLVFPNGIDRRRQERDLLVSETFADRVSAVPVSADGTPGPRRTLATLSSGDGPDGLTCDDDGGAWVACAYGQKAVHVSPEGEVDAIIPVPGRGVLCCLLSGPRRRTLYLAVASTDEEYAARHQTGSILAVELG